MYWLWWKPNIQSTSWCLGWSIAIVTLCLISSTLKTSDSTRWPPSSAWGVAFGRPNVYKTTPRHVTKAGELSLRSEKISVITWPLTSGYLIPPPITIPLIIMCGGTVEWETKKTLSNTKDELKVRITLTLIGIIKNAMGKVWRESEVVCRALLKTQAISLNKFNL